MSAIDFAQLLRTEKKKQKGRRSTDRAGDADAPDNNNKKNENNNKSDHPQLSSAVHPTFSNQDQPVSLCRPSTADMSAIDFSQLMKTEKKKQDGRKRGDETFHSTNFPMSSLVPIFSDEESLQFTNLFSRDICNTTKSIQYSSTCLKDDAALQAWLGKLPAGDSGLGVWKSLTYGKRRACMFGEEDTSLPLPLLTIATNLVIHEIFPADRPPNHVLLNEYQAGEGIMPHTDGPIYDSRTATLSLGSNAILQFTKRLASSEIGMSSERDVTTTESSSDHSSEVLLEDGSLIVFQGEAYLDYCHGITANVLKEMATERCLNAPESTVVYRGHRYSLTFRHKRGSSFTEEEDEHKKQDTSNNIASKV